jgi:excisionase family DNA binding protein
MLRKKKFPPAVVPPSSTDPNDRWLLTSGAAAYIKVSPQTIRSMLHRGEIPAIRLGPGVGGYHIDRADLDRWLERQKKIIRPYRRGSRPWVAKRWAERRTKTTR